MLKVWSSIKNWFINIFDLNRDRVVSYEDAVVAKLAAEKRFKDANEAINRAVTEAKFRADRVKEEVKDVGKALNEVGNQLDDVVSAAKTSKNRPGRKKKTD